jgi:hypothetical protein
MKRRMSVLSHPMARVAGFVCLPALLAGCAETGAQTEEDIATAAQALTYGSSCSSTGACAVQITVPEGVPETQLIFSATDFVHINDRAKVSSLSGVTPVAFSNGGWARIGVDTTVGHFLAPNKYLQVGNTNQATRKLYGDLYSGGAPTELLGPYLGGAHIFTTGQVIEPRTNSRQPIAETNTIWSFNWPTATAANPIEKNKTGSWDLYSDPSTDKYIADVTIERGQTLVLKPGSHFFNNLTVNSGGVLKADTSTTKPVRLAVAGNINLNAPVSEQRDPLNTEAPSRFLFAYVGNATAVNATRGMEAVFVAPDASISLWTPVRGAVFGKAVEVHQDATVKQGFDPVLLQNPGTTPGQRLPDNPNTRFVEKLGYLDGRTCDHWPVDLEPSKYVAGLNSSASADAKAATDKLLSELSRANNNVAPVITAFGSMNELVLTSYTEYSEVTKGIERRAVVVDPNTKRGYDISYARVCRESEDLKSTSTSNPGCTTRSIPVLINGAVVTVDVFGRATPDVRAADSSEAFKSVELIAPTVRIEPASDALKLYGQSLVTNRLQLDVNLIVAAENVVVGKDAGNSTIEIEVRPYAATTPQTWQADLNAPTRPGVLSIFASKITGVTRIVSVNGARVSQVNCYAAPGYTIPGTTSGLMANWRVSPATSDLYITRTVSELHVASTLFPSGIPFRNAPQAGGFVSMAGSPSRSMELLAPSMAGISSFGCPITPSNTPATLPKSTQSFPVAATGLQAAQIFSKGLLYKAIVNDAEAASVSTGLPSAKYVHASDVLDAIDPNGTEQLGIDRATQGRVRSLALASASTAPINLNALAVPYGAIAKAWQPDDPTASSADTAGDLRLHWKDVNTTAINLATQMTDQNRDAIVDALVNSVRNLALGLQSYSESIKNASVNDQVAQTEALGNLQNAIVELDKAQSVFRTNMCDATGNPDDCSWETITRTMKNSADQVVKDCKAAAESGGWLDAVTAIASVCPYIGAGVKAFGYINDALKAGEKGMSLLGLQKASPAANFKGSLQSMEDNKKWVGFAGDAAKFLSESSGTLKGALGVMGLIDEGECTDSGDLTTAMTAMTSAATAMAVVEGLAIQARTIHAILQSVGSTLEYQVANESASVSLGTAADEAVAATKAWNPTDLKSDAIKRAQFVADSCNYTKMAVRAGEAELIGFTHRLQTSAGWATTTSGATVPAGPLTTEQTASLIDTLFDTSKISSWFNMDFGAASIGNTAIARFGALVDVMCNQGTSGGTKDQIPTTFMYVKKRIVGEQLASFKSQGFLRFSVDLDDLVRDAADFSSLNKLSATSYQEGTTWKDLSSPVVLGATYSGCWGTNPDNPCCTTAGCRAALGGTNPSLVRRPSAQIPSQTGCVDEGSWVLSQTPMARGGSNIEVRTCMQEAQTDTLVQQLDFNADAPSNPSQVVSSVKNEICSLAPDTLYFNGLRGTPVFGEWGIGYNGDFATALMTHRMNELGNTCTPTPNPDPNKPPLSTCEFNIDPDQNLQVTPEWLNANAGLTGIEVILVVAAEPLTATRAAQYQQSPYINKVWREWPESEL